METADATRPVVTPAGNRYRFAAARIPPRCLGSALPAAMPKRDAHMTTPEGAALLEVIFETAATFFRLREAGKRTGAVTPWGGGLLGMLRTLEREGPRTVPQIARSRPVARQRIQKLANEMAADGLIEFVDNPGHRRSKLLRLTPKGAARYAQLMSEMTVLCEDLAAGLRARDLRTTAEVLRRLREKL